MPNGMFLGPGLPTAPASMFAQMQPPQHHHHRSGGFMQGLSEFFLGKPAKMSQVPNFNPMQQAALNQLLSQAMGNIDFGPIEQQARQNLRQQTIPSIAERFTNMGAGGQRSSAFAQALGQAGAGLESNLANMKQGRLMQMLQMGLTPQTSTMYQPSSQGFLGNIAGGLGQGIGMLPLLMTL